MKKYKQLFMFNEEDVKSTDVIKDLIDTNWSTDNEAQMKSVQMLKGIALSDEDSANKFMKEIDDFTSGLKVEDFE